MSPAIRVDRHDRFAVHRRVTAPAIDHLEAAPATLPDADVGLPASSRGDPRDGPGYRVTHEVETEP